MTPAMAAGIMDHVLTTPELLSYRVPDAFLDKLQGFAHLFQPIKDTSSRQLRDTTRFQSGDANCHASSSALSLRNRQPERGCRNAGSVHGLNGFKQ